MAQGKGRLNGAFITFEGIDGCGKTTQAQLLAAYLREKGHTVLETREPGGTSIGTALRAILQDAANRGMTPLSELLLYLADRVQHLAETIRPALARGETVVCDRFHDATVAYQHHGRGLDFGSVAPLIEREIAITPPDLTFWLDVSLGTARERLTRRGASGTGPEARIEGEAEAFHERVRGGYAALHRQHPRRIVRVDAAEPIEALAGRIRRELEERYVV